MFSMSTYTDSDIEELRDLVKENNKILLKLKRRSDASAVFTFVKWVVVIGVAVGAFTFVQPYLEHILNTYESISEGVSSINEAKDSVSDLSLGEFIKIIERND